ncbi:DUF397 domain-containing protein [Kitasatospora acidiphila]|uniref:DUF397 domain-containing protein n=1 Tax=Kitasatospora acidiphila TaxID=2567942 RepID=A0A540W5V3_9ACTN|nr:DUF397 domain-containing protein [Kitasatospora acidiphila]TQF04370.1 DUF397 domain-containing protein [Kitasatospora acidiphila]
MTDLTATAWVKSSYSQNGGNCVEVAPGLPGVTPVRDSKDPEGPALYFPADGFATFLRGIKNGALGNA